MMKSFTLERWALYTEERNDAFRFSLRVPPSWKSTRTFSGGGTFLKQFTSPAFGDGQGRPDRARLPHPHRRAVPAGRTVDAFYQATQAKLGETFQLLGHTPWKDGYVDVLRTETPMAESRGKRFYRVADGPRLHAGLRGPRRRLPAGVALVRHDRGHARRWARRWSAK